LIEFLLLGAPGKAQMDTTSILFLIGMLVLFYVLLFLPQQRKEKEHRRLIESLKKGDEVITASGIFGTVVDVRDKTVIVRIAEKVNVKMDKLAVMGRIKGEEEKG